jgi:signal transduction histidine kinase/ActR/RegA family two-component response regulator
LRHNEVLGWVKAVWIPGTIPIHGAVFTLLLMVQVVIALYCRVLKQKRHLEERVRERTAELSQTNSLLKREITERSLAESKRQELQQSLVRSKKMESLGILAGGVAHDLNNVLSGIVSYPDLLLHDMGEDHPLRSTIVTIRDSGLRAAQIVQDLLTLARRGVVSRKILNLNELIGEYCNSPEYSKLIDGSVPITVELTLDPNLKSISASAIGIKKVLMNLVANAVEAQPHGGRIVIATTEVTLTAPYQGFQALPAGDYVVLAVSDQGEGISEEDRQRIFEPFYTKKVMGRSGTGLGLTVVWGTVEDHNGAIDLISQPGKGTTISIYLPICSDGGESSGDAGEKPREILGQGETILVVDDLPPQREIACAMLQRMNYRPLAAESGEDALALLKEQAVDLLILDMIMDGGMDGLDTYREIIKMYPGQKAIVASGFSESERVREVQRLGAGLCLKKPYTVEELAEAVQQELRRADDGNEPSGLAERPEESDICND